ncbi:hypothetical protein GCM10027612_58090 [Microbispora bryophytorum subsp. camponoti]
MPHLPHIALVTPLALLAPLALLGTLLIAGLVVLVMRLRRLRVMQAEAARQAAAEAREQFGRDVHDLVSSRLWLASLRSELAYRLADDDSPLRPALADVVQSIRQASADIRNVTRSFRDVSLASELANARAVLHAYGTDCKVEATEAELGDEVSAVLAIMVREAVTNVLRHSRATLCTIEIVVRGGVATLTVANDGVAPPYDPATAPGWTTSATGRRRSTAPWERSSTPTAGSVSSPRSPAGAGTAADAGHAHPPRPGVQGATPASSFGPPRVLSACRPRTCASHRPQPSRRRTQGRPHKAARTRPRSRPRSRPRTAAWCV